MAFCVQNWHDLCWRGQMLRTYFYKKNIKNMDRVKELFLETEEPLTVKLPTCWEFYLGQCLAFLKAVWKCIGLLPNFCPACQVKNRRGVSAHARTFLIDWEESQHSFQRYHSWWGRDIWAWHRSQAVFVLLESLSSPWVPDKFDKIRRACSLVSSTFIELCIVNCLYKDKL
jgi:hypothetical protein